MWSGKIAPRLQRATVPATFRAPDVAPDQHCPNIAGPHSGSETFTTGADKPLLVAFYSPSSLP